PNSTTPSSPSPAASSAGDASTSPTHDRVTSSTDISPTYAKQILELQAAGATEEDLHPLVAEAITESYFTEWGTRAKGLRADFTHVQSINFRF
ncbi:hypothetical protein ABT002_34985, partial [Streptomyces goshikiensis]